MVTKKTTEAPVEAGDESNFSFTHILLVLLVLLNAAGLYLLAGNSFSFSGNTSIDPVGIKKAILEVEYDKAGGKERYELMQQANLLSLTNPKSPNYVSLDQIKTYIASFGSGWAVGPTTGTTDDSTFPTLAADKISAITADAAIDGNKDADILVVEYSDMECPYCIKQYQNTRLLEQLHTQYGDKVKFAFKNNRGVNHPGTEAKAIGALCAQKVGGDTAYNIFYNTVMAGSSTETGVYAVSALPDAAKVAGVDMKKWQSCVDNKDTLSQFATQTAEAEALGLSGTPGTLILNVKTGKYSTVSGALPFASFSQKIDALMN